MDPAIIAAYNASRDFSQKAVRSICYAPHSSLYFSMEGEVRVCCHNWSHPVGNISRQTIGQIWNGEAMETIRRALESGSFAAGCQYCEWQMATGSFVNLSMPKWDEVPVYEKDPAWPLQMEFSIGNTCNLECIMCDGKASSAIRAHREKLPPLRSPYSDAFFVELRSYLPHLKKARFLGGEPFLQSECFRIWEMLVEDGMSLPCHVTTNGTQFNRRVERFLEKMPFSISISLDGYRKETIEAIRVNAKYDLLMRNVRSFREYTRRKKTGFGLTYCLMRPNWEEFGDFCLFADSLGCRVFVNAVRRPPHLSLYTLSRAELAQVADSLERKAPDLVPRLNQNRAIWTGEVERIRSRAAGQSPMLDRVQINLSKE
jgi:radical SAM protein with 4Fe4S-binding SPASM domain